MGLQSVQCVTVDELRSYVCYVCYVCYVMYVVFIMYGYACFGVLGSFVKKQCIS